MNLETAWTLLESYGQVPTQGPISQKSRIYITKKSIPLLLFGMDCPLNKLFSLRIITTWTNTAKLQKLVPSQANGDIDNTIKAKNNLLESFTQSAGHYQTKQYNKTKTTGKPF